MSVRLLGEEQPLMLYLVCDGMQWSTILEEYATHQRATRLSDKTIENRHDCLMMLAARSHRAPDEITLADLENHLGRRHARKGTPLAQGTMQAERSYLQAFFRWARKRGHIKTNPAKGLDKIKMTRRKPRPLRAEQIDGMLDSGAYARTRDIITIAALTGLRIGEIVRIRGEDVDWEGRTIATIRKGGLHHRVALPDGLNEFRDRYPTRGWWFPSKQTNRRFPNGGGHILMESASAAVSKAIRRAGITDPNITGHSLRHYLATTMLRNGAPLRVVQETLGHASLATTQLYTEVTEEELQDGINVVPPIPLRSRSGRGKIAA